MDATWNWCSFSTLKLLAETELYRLFKLPKFVIALDKKTSNDELANALRLYGYTIERYSRYEARGDLGLFLCDLGKPKNHEEYSWYTASKGGSAVSLGSTFMQEPAMVAQQVAFWLPLEQFARFPEKQLAFRKQCKIHLIVDQDNVPIKTKRIWFKKFFAALKMYQEQKLPVKTVHTDNSLMKSKTVKATAKEVEDAVKAAKIAKKRREADRKEHGKRNKKTKKRR